MRKAHTEIETSRIQIETAFNHLEDKIRGSTVRVQELGVKALDRLKSSETYVRSNPVPFAALFLLTGFVLGSTLSRRDRRRSIPVGEGSVEDPMLGGSGLAEHLNPGIDESAAAGTVGSISVASISSSASSPAGLRSEAARSTESTEEEIAAIKKAY